MSKKEPKKYKMIKGDIKMNNFSDFIKANKEKIYRMAEANTVKNEKNIPVITKDDPWRDETEWDAVYRDDY